jgi:hypothetical protein
MDFNAPHTRFFAEFSKIIRGGGRVHYRAVPSGEKPISFNPRAAAGFALFVLPLSQFCQFAHNKFGQFQTTSTCRRFRGVGNYFVVIAVVQGISVD